MRRILRGALIPVLLVVLWEVSSRAGILPMDTTSRPTLVLAAGYQGLADGSILKSTWQTIEAAMFGFLIATVIGVLCGVVLGLSRRLESIVGPSVDALRPIPAVALIPLSLLLFGFGLNLEAAVVAFACVWPILLVTIAAVQGIEPRLLELARVLEMPFATRMRKIILPAALGRITVGLRVAISISLVVAVTVEIVINPRGLGYSMIMAQQSLKPELMYAQLLWLGALGWTLNAALQKAVSYWPGMNELGGQS
ncbi:MAG: ABC transporter permease subunit [Betaproteobacteria bacterium]|nr:ABC transporter permease subunit [Betaproteobacteria bacterium]